MIEFLHPEKGWIRAYDVFTWEECQWINNLIGREVYRKVEDGS